MAAGTPRMMRADDFVAESLEAMAKNMPQAEGDIWREAAQKFRASASTRMVRVWENAKEAVDFIRPDPASVR